MQVQVCHSTYDKRHFSHVRVNIVKSSRNGGTRRWRKFQMFAVWVQSAHTHTCTIQISFWGEIRWGIRFFSFCNSSRLNFALSFAFAIDIEVDAFFNLTSSRFIFKCCDSPMRWWCFHSIPRRYYLNFVYGIEFHTLKIVGVVCRRRVRSCLSLFNLSLFCRSFLCCMYPCVLYIRAMLFYVKFFSSTRWLTHLNVARAYLFICFSVYLSTNHRSFL